MPTPKPLPQPLRLIVHDEPVIPQSPAFTPAFTLTFTRADPPAAPVQPRRPLAGESPASNARQLQIPPFAGALAGAPYLVLIAGESGRGKEPVAQSGRHRQTRRSPPPFLAINRAVRRRSAVSNHLEAWSRA